MKPKKRQFLIVFHDLMEENVKLIDTILFFENWIEQGDDFRWDEAIKDEQLGPVVSNGLEEFEFNQENVMEKSLKTACEELKTNFSVKKL